MEPLRDEQWPPKYPLDQAEQPVSCRMTQEDLVVHNKAGMLSINNNTTTTTTTTTTNNSNNSFLVSEDSKLISSPSSTPAAVGKKRLAEEQGMQDLSASSEVKRRLTFRLSGAGDQPEGYDDESADFLKDEPTHEDNSACAEMEDVCFVHPGDGLEEQEKEEKEKEKIHSSTVNTDLPLPSPSASPVPSNGYDDLSFTAQKKPLNSLELIDCLGTCASNSLSNKAFNNLVFKLLTKVDRTSLSDLNDTINKCLKRDIITSLPTELSLKILKLLDYNSLRNIGLVCKSWNNIIIDEFWLNLAIRDNFITETELDDYYKHKKLPLNFKTLKSVYLTRYKLYCNWIDPNFEPKRITLQGHGSPLVACLQLTEEHIITGADDKKINIYDLKKGKLLRTLVGHEGGVWALKCIGNQIISGATDRTVRIWDKLTGKCTHIFRGHTSTIRSMEIVTLPDTEEKLIITGSRDNTLHVWKLPTYNQDEDFFDDNEGNNPYFITVLRGHTLSVRTVVGYGDLVISGSYDNTVRVWDLKRKCTKFVLTGHTDRIYAIILDHKRNRCISASMDARVRVWDLNNGECIAHLTSHTLLVGLLGLSEKYLVTAAADGTIRGWDPDNYKSVFTLHHDNHTAITTFCSSSNLLVSGGEGQFNIYDLKNGHASLARCNLLPDCGQVWSAKFDFARCVVAVEKNTRSFIEILDFSEGASKFNSLLEEVRPAGDVSAGADNESGDSLDDADEMDED